jgi:hypothetical protein
MSEEQKKPATISREELYQQVWETPMSHLGEKYGISGNGLKKICDRLNVPYPPRGYWAKLAAGKLYELFFRPADPAAVIDRFLPAKSLFTSTLQFLSQSPPPIPAIDHANDLAAILRGQ